ncbi:MAG: phosphoglycolate phosphatase [Thermoprotei archaeon]
MNSREIAVVSDYDRTLACESDGFRIRESLKDVINEFSRRHVFIVASGREERIIRQLAPGLKPTAWVLENGAKLVFQDTVILIRDEGWIEAREIIAKKLEDKGIRHSFGDVIIYVDGMSPKVNEILELVKGLGHVERNRQDLMILPKGVSKAKGVLRALEILNFKGKLYALGDSENDLSLFQIADVRVAVANAIEELKAQADIVLKKPNGEGVEDFLKDLMRATQP